MLNVLKSIAMIKSFKEEEPCERKAFMHGFESGVSREIACLL
jgi:hypothetical protein